VWFASPVMHNLVYTVYNDFFVCAKKYYYCKLVEKKILYIGLYSYCIILKQIRKLEYINI